MDIGPIGLSVLAIMHRLLAATGLGSGLFVNPIGMALFLPVPLRLLMRHLVWSLRKPQRTALVVVLVLNAAPLPAAPRQDESPPDAVRAREAWTTESGLPTLRIFNGTLTVQPALRLDIDFGAFWDQPRYVGNQPPPYLDHSLRGIPPHGLNVRRARIGLQGKLGDHVSYRFQWSFEVPPGELWEPTKHSRLFELQAAYSGIAGTTLRAGIFAPRHLIEYSMSSFELTMLERPAIVQLAASLASGNARLGLGGERHGDQWFVAAYATGGSTLRLNDGGQRGLVGRANATILDRPGVRIVLGANMAMQFRPGFLNRDASVRLRDYPELRLDPTRLLDTGSQPADSALALGPEFAAIIGPLYLQAEYQTIRVEGAMGMPGQSYWGYYLTAALPLIGAPRHYTADRGTFVRPEFSEFSPAVANSGWLELATRWSYASLDDGTIRGGRQGIASVALNWFPSRSLRLSLQYMNGAVRLDGPDRSFQAIAGRIAINW